LAVVICISMNSCSNTLSLKSKEFKDLTFLKISRTSFPRRDLYRTIRYQLLKRVLFARLRDQFPHQDRLLQERRVCQTLGPISRSHHQLKDRDHRSNHSIDRADLLHKECSSLILDPSSKLPKKISLNPHQLRLKSIPQLERLVDCNHSSTVNIRILKWDNIDYSSMIIKFQLLLRDLLTN